jgi:hypothetical protein
MARNPLGLRWRSEQRQVVVSKAKPDELVRVESLDTSLAGQLAQVFLVPESLVRRVIYKVTKRVGVPQVPLKFDSSGSSGVLSEVWAAAQFPPPQKPTRYVASTSGRVSAPSIVTNQVVFEMVRSQARDQKLNVRQTSRASCSGASRPIGNSRY